MAPNATCWDNETPNTPFESQREDEEEPTFARRAISVASPKSSTKIPERGSDWAKEEKDKRLAKVTSCFQHQDIQVLMVMTKNEEYI